MYITSRGPSCMELWGGVKRRRCLDSWKIPLGDGFKSMF